MVASVPWNDVLAAPAPGQHIAHFYSEPDFPERTVADFVGEGLRRGEAIIVIATPPHWQGVARRLGEQRFDLDELERRGQLAVLDAASCLARLLVNGVPDREQFRAVIGGTVATAERAGYSSIRAFGEMVDLLRHTDLNATIRLEDLWTEFLAVHPVALLCGYSADVFEPDVYRSLFERVSAAHTHLIPVEDHARLDQAVERAYTDVFGTEGDADSLRRVFLAEYGRATVMPDGEAAILAARAFVPMTTATLLERARHHYRLR